MSVAKIRIENGERPRKYEDGEILQIVVEQELEGRPLAVSEGRVPRTNDEIEDLLASAAEEVGWLPGCDLGRLTRDGVSLASTSSSDLQPPPE
jgi:hypothetical protein